MATHWFKFLSVILLYLPSACPKYVKGTVKTRSDWTFVTRFCFKDNVRGRKEENIARMSYRIRYLESFSVLNLLLYYDTQWPGTYPKPELNCREKEANLYVGYNQVINLTTTFPSSGCTLEKKELELSTLTCEGERMFLSTRERWWFMVISNCDSTQGLSFDYEFHFTNGEGFWLKEFSADERYILEVDIAFFVFFIILLLLGLRVTKQLMSRRLFHVTYKFFLVSLVLECLSLAFFMGFYVKYGKEGIENKLLKVLGRASHFMSQFVFLVLLILLGKGWTVTRGRISSTGVIKLSVFCTLYAVCLVVLFIYDRVVFDPGEVLYIYESPAGVGICVLRVIGWLWFCYGVFFTLKHYSSKSAFYYPFWFIYTLWFLTGPITVVIATYVLDMWMRAKVVNGIEWTTSLVAHAFFLGITRPTAANRNFPYHLRTNQISIESSSPIPGSGNQAYTLPATRPTHSPNAAKLIAMFQASTTNSGTPPGVRDSFSALQNGNTDAFRMTKLS